MRKISILAIALALTGISKAQQPQLSVADSKQPTSNLKPIQVCEKDLVWTDARPPLAPGAKVAIIEGNPKTSGHFTIRMKFPPYYKVPAHTHPVDERTTVISGAMYVGYGNTLDTTNAKKFTPGCFYMNPTGMVHYAFTGDKETIIQISTTGPWRLDLYGHTEDVIETPEK